MTPQAANAVQLPMLRRLRCGTCSPPLDMSYWSLSCAHLRELYLNREWNKGVDSLHLPPQLELLMFGDDFNQPLSLPFELPLSLITLHIGNTTDAQFNQPMQHTRLPPSLRKLHMPGEAFAPAAHELPLLPPLLNLLHVYKPKCMRTVWSFLLAAPCRSTRNMSHHPALN